MQSGLYVGISSQIALERRLNTIADNMANMNTVGFRATEVKFDEVLSSTKNELNAKVAFVTQGNDYLSTRPGQMQQTGNSLDFAIKGDAWFSIDTPAGDVLTRDGRFTMQETGALVSLMGYPVLDAGGAPIQLNRNGGPPEVGADGRITQDGVPVATLGLFTADVSEGFIRADNSGVITVDVPQPVVDNFQISVVQGYIEGSNVNGISEMTQLIQVNRAFEGISSLMRDTEATFGEAIKTLGSGR
ncbi:flagellar basal-body rod protein FlgF [Neorhizobium sp. T786]|uniref:flagellar basal-body rod protein FlgF n=1 Tax=Pseudorhizobium xiangyangii TaxID=2883104 RepID=UPI001CFFA980|nr:flagellar basal-body rod protein FlgF [Neorhizobium xiangyangii]MCB5202642.1 flagellar basal-body rod protein FlgF [Neorhizobium xiangyangii]